MASYRLSKLARDQLKGIYAFTDTKFGRYQADAYAAGLERSFGLIGDFPRMGLASDALSRGYRRLRFQSHYIFYTEERDHVLIRALIHTAQDLRPDLFD